MDYGLDCAVVVQPELIRTSRFRCSDHRCWKLFGAVIAVGDWEVVEFEVVVQRLERGMVWRMHCHDVWGLGRRSKPGALSLEEVVVVQSVEERGWHVGVGMLGSEWGALPYTIHDKGKDMANDGRTISRIDWWRTTVTWISISTGRKVYALRGDGSAPLVHYLTWVDDVCSRV
jgi:hypothetical protein